MQYIRDPDYINQHLHEQEDGSIITDTACRIQIPERYVSRGMAVLGTETHILGFFGIIMGNRYGVSRTISMMRINPSSTEKVSIDGVPYYDFHFDAGETVFASTELVQNDMLAFAVYDEHIDKGNIPWYFNYFDIAMIMDTAEEFAGFFPGNRAIISLIISTIARDPKDYTRPYRHIFTKHSDIYENPPAITPFRSVIWNTSDTTSKLIGAYSTDSTISALVNPSQKVEHIEELLRT